MAIIDEDRKDVIEKFRKDITEFLGRWGDNKERLENWKTGASPSYALQWMKEKGWKNLGTLYDFEINLRIADFDVKPGKLKNGKDHKSALIVYDTRKEE